MSENVQKPTAGSSVFLKSLIVVLLLVAIAAVVYRLYLVKPVPNDSKLAGLEKTLQDIRAAMNVDSVRQYNIQKVMKIISKYNQDLPSSVRYEIAEEIFDMSVKYTNLDVDLLCATITQESGATWSPEIVSESGAMGLMQIMPTTAMWVASYEGITWTSPEEILFNPIYNIRIGSRYLSALIERYNLEGGLAAFNGGEKRAALWLTNNKADGTLSAETSNFLPRVLALYSEFKSMTL
ncbi:MAG TPA: lytic transglycosylase domain-containing protein [bacterium]|jgi:soluble lytic murein transglycosylase-like protein